MDYFVDSEITDAASIFRRKKRCLFNRGRMQRSGFIEEFCPRITTKEVSGTAGECF